MIEKRTTPPFRKISGKSVLTLLMLFFSLLLVQGTVMGQSEEELLESIGDELMDEESKKKELEEKEKKYDKLKAKADKALNKEDFDDAEKLYKQMGEIFPEKDYPNLQLRLVKQQREQKELAEKEGKFKGAMEEGNKYLEKEDFDKAKASFQKAMKIFPDDREPKDKLKEVVKKKEEVEKRKEEELKQKKYDEFISDADKALKDKDFETAKQKYKAAAKVKPDEKYPKDQLIETAKQEEIEEERKKQEAIDNKYNEIIAQADDLLKDNKWDKAKEEYQKAVKLKPEESYPKDKIIEAEKLKEEEAKRAEEEAIQKKYDEAINKADDLLKDEKWDEAVAKYNEAAEIKRDDDYPKKQIEKATQAKERAEKAAEEAAIQAELDERYENHINRADKLFDNNQFEEALAEYQKAAEVKENEKYPEKQIQKVQDAIAERKKQEQREELIAEYELILEEAEQFEKEENYDEALSRLEKAKAVWDEDKRADKKIKEVTKLRDEKRAAEEEAATAQAAYDEAMTTAKNARESENWDDAINAFKKALEAKPGDKDAQNELDATEEAKKFAESKAKKEAERERQELAKKNKYDELMEKGSEALEAEKWSDAKANFRQASELFPEEEKPQELIQEVDRRKEEKEKRQREAAEKAEQEAEELEERYRLLIQEAEDAAELKEFEGAISLLKQAKELKPSSEEPDRMLSNIERMQAKAESERKREEEQASKRAEAYQAYLDKVEEANSALIAKNFTQAISLYKKAIDMQPEGEEEDLTDKIDEARQKIEEKKAEAKRKELEEQERLEAINEQYSELMGKGETEVQKKNWTEAKNYFRQAQEVKPSAAGPRERIEDVERLIAKQESEKRKMEEAERAAKERENKYIELITRADEALQSEDWVNAKSLYRKAADLKPEEDYPADQAKKVDKIREEAEAAAREAAAENELKEALMKGDQALSAENFDEAIRSFSKALEIEEGNKEAKSKLEEAKQRKIKAAKEAAEKREAELAAAREEARKAAAEKREKQKKEREERMKRLAENKPEALADNYPEGSTKEVEDQGYRIVEKTIVVEGGKGRKLIKMSYPWGQEFYYLNGKQITGGAYRHNLKKYL